MTTPADPFRAGTKIPQVEFVRELNKKGAFNSPLFNGYADQAAKETAARMAYNTIMSGGHSAEIFLGIMGREHTWGTATNSVLRRNDTRSMGNARSIRKPGLGGTIITDSVRRSQYAKYLDFDDSVEDFVYRINDPGYAYAGKVSIADVVSTIAPAEDSNDPEGYAWFLCTYTDGLRSRLTDPIPGGDTPSFPFIAADRRHYTPGRTVPWPTMLIMHHTDGYDSLVWLTTSPKSDVSATYLFNNDGSIRAQLVRHEDTPHTTGRMNPTSLSVEWERKWPQQEHINDSQYEKLGKSVAYIWRKESERGNPHFSVPPTDAELNRHKDYYSTECPGNLDMDRVLTLLQLNLSLPVPPEIYVQPGNPFGAVPVQLGFRAHIMQVGTALFPDNPGAAILAEYGWAVAPEYRTEFGSAQEFEKSILTWHRGTPEPWDIQQLHRGAPRPEAA